MTLPINIDALLHGETVEWDRIELKKGWNPEKILHSICAFANDFNNWDGGYIIIGVEEENGVAKLPPIGLETQEIDNIQKKLVELSYKIYPHYLPKYQPYLKDGKQIFVIWAHAGDNRPYKVPIGLSEKKGETAFYVKKGSITSIVKAGSNEERKLLELSARIPFDDRINQNASLSDLSFPLIREYLYKVKSKLYEDSSKIPFLELCKQMNLIKGHPEDLRPVNIALLMFNENPEKFFKGARIDLVLHKDEKGRNFIEKTFKGPIDKQLKDALDFIQTQIIHEEVIKVKDKPEAIRFYNYPLEALEEVLANAVYHKGYDHENPIEVQIFPNRIEVLSFPGPLPPVDSKMLKKKRIITRNYRNRRIGEFLKELNLTEGKATGFPIIHDSLETNGSPPPVFETDDSYTNFLATIGIHPLAQQISYTEDKLTKDLTQDEREMTQDVTQDKSLNFKTLREIDAFLRSAGDLRWNEVKKPIINKIDDETLEIILFCLIPRSRQEIFDHLDLFNNSRNSRKYIQPLTDLGWLQMTDPENITSKHQKYQTSEIAKMLII